MKLNKVISCILVICLTIMTAFSSVTVTDYATINYRGRYGDYLGTNDDIENYLEFISDFQHEKRVTLKHDIEIRTDKFCQYDQNIRYLIEVNGTTYLDLNGHSLKVTNIWNEKHNTEKYWPDGFEGDGVDLSSLFHIGNGDTLVVYDSKGGGSINYDAAFINENSDNYCVSSCRNIFEVDGGTLIIDGGEFNAGSNRSNYYYATRFTIIPMPYDLEGTNNEHMFTEHIFGYAHTVVAGTAVHAVKGEVIINGGEFIGRNTFYSAREYSCALSIDPENYNDVKVTINDGYFDGRCSANSLYIRSNVEPEYFQINGGTFDVHHIGMERTCYTQGYYKGVNRTNGISYVPLKYINNCDVYYQGTKCKHIDDKEAYKETHRTSKGNVVLKNKGTDTGYLTLTSDSYDGKITVHEKGSLYQYTPGNNFTVTFDDFEYAYFDKTNSSTCNSTTDVRLDVTWTIEMYKNGEATGLKRTIKNHSTSLNLDEVMNRFDTTKEFQWNAGSDVTYKIDVVVTELAKSDYSVLSSVHTPSHGMYVTGYDNQVIAWAIDLSPITPVVDYELAKQVLIDGYLQNDYMTVTDVGYYSNLKDYRERNGVSYQDGDVLNIGSTVYVAYTFKAENGYAISQMCDFKVPDHLKVNNYYTWGLGTGADISNVANAEKSDIVRIVFEVVVSKPLTGNVSLGTVYTDYCSYFDVHTNATGLEVFTVQSVNEDGEIENCDWFGSVRDAFDHFRAVGNNVPGQKVRLAVRTLGSFGELHSAWRYVEKTPNDNIPDAPEVTINESAEGYVATITNYNKEQEYILRTSYVDPSALPEDAWEGTLPYEFNVKSGKVVIYTRYKETNNYCAGSVVKSLTTCAGKAVYAEDIKLNTNVTTVEVDESVKLLATILPETQYNMENADIRWTLVEGDPEAVSITTDKGLKSFPTNGSYVSGSELIVTGRKQATVVIAAEITLPGNVHKNVKCTVYVTSNGEALIDNITQPTDNVYVYPGDFYCMQIYDVTPFFAYDTTVGNLTWAINSVSGDASHFTLSPDGMLDISEAAVPGEKVYIYPVYDEYYRYAYLGQTPIKNTRCIEVIEKDSELLADIAAAGASGNGASAPEAGNGRTRARSGSATVINASTGNDSDVITFASSDTNVATVDNNGIVRMISAGDVTITVTSGDDKKEFAFEVIDCFHVYTIEDLGDGTHKKVCRNCGEEVIEQHSLGEVLESDEGVFRACSCGYTEAAEIEETFDAYIAPVTIAHVHEIGETEYVSVDENGEEITETHETGEMIYDENAHWMVCADQNCPDMESSKSGYTAHNFSEISYTKPGDETIYTATICPDCGYVQGTEVSYRITEAAEKKTITVPVFNIDDPSTYEIHNYVPVSEKEAEAIVATVTEPEPEATPAPTISPVITEPEKSEGNALRIILGILGVALLGGIGFFGYKTFAGKGAKKDEE